MIEALAASSLAASAQGELLDVLVIGAGQAGMSAAHELAKSGLTFRVLEATDHVGGRTRNVDVRTGQMDVDTDDVIEIGGTWLSPDHTAALQLSRELGVEAFNASFVPDSADFSVKDEDDWPWWFWGSDYPKDQRHLLRESVFFSGGHRRLFRSPAQLPDLGMRKAEELLRRASRGLGDKCWRSNGTFPLWRLLDKGTTWSNLGAGLRSPDAQQALRNCIHGKNAQEPEAVSFLYNMLSFSGCNSKGPDSQYRLRGGTQALPLRLARRLKSQVLLDHQVIGIKSSEDEVLVSIQDRAPMRARTAILTGPPPAILSIDFDPPLDGANAQWLQRMPMGTSLKLAAVYKEGPWWREIGLQGDILATRLPQNLSLPEPDSDLPLFVQCMDHSPYSQALGVIVCFMEGRQNLYFTGLAPAEQRRLFLNFLFHSFGTSKAIDLNPDIVAHNWADQPFARGAYTGFFAPGVMSVPAFWSAFQKMEKLPNVFLAGSDYHIGFGNGYIEGAIRDGQRAAQMAMLRLQRPVVV
ncbi:unnamed protein product [Effrenium voratum]|nr:unnamed protein product [Effrenium voratum]